MINIKKIISSVFVLNIIGAGLLFSGDRIAEISGSLSEVYAETASADLKSDVIAEGQLGKTVGFVLYSDGRLVVNGNGPMDDLCRIYNYREYVRSIEFESDDVNYIGDHAFEGCVNLTDINIPESIYTIGNYAFQGCTSLKRAVVNLGTDKIGHSVFRNCYALEELTLPYPSARERYAHGNGVYSTDCSVTDIVCSKRFGKITDEYSLKKITILGGETVPNGAFSGLSTVREIILPDSVDSIRFFAFQGCSSLESFYMSDNVYRLGEYSFDDCTSLKEVRLSPKIEVIFEKTFRNCKSL